MHRAKRRKQGRLLTAAAIAVAVTAVAAGPAAAVPYQPGTVGCPPGAESATPSAEYQQSIASVLESRRDAWGEESIAGPQGPTYEAVADRLKPIRYGIGPKAFGSALADSFFYYVPFGQPTGLTSRDEIALHVADGSQIISNKSGNRSMRTYIGAEGAERFGECWGNLEEPGLLDGHLPVLEVSYEDHDGVRYQQESFATYLPGTGILASYVKVTANRAQSGRDSTQVRFQACNCRLAQEGNRLVANGKTYLYMGDGAAFSGRDVVHELDLSDGADHSVYLVRVNAADAGAPPVLPGAATHLAARQSSVGYWQDRLAGGGTFDVPERLVMDAQRNMLVQNLLLTWRYSVGNAYEAFYQPESSGTSENLGKYGFTDVYRSSLQDLLPKSKGANRRNWEIGEKLLRAADHYWLTRDPSLIDQNNAAYAAYADDLATQHRNDPNGLLERQQYSSDIKNDVNGLHQIGRALYGLKAIIAVWRETGHAELADEFAPVAEELDANLQRVADAESVKLDDGTLFTPVALFEEEPYDQITDSTLGGYWNLVAQYGFASKVYAPGSSRARRTLDYLFEHGSRLAGGLRARLGGLDDVYGVEQLRFLADNDEADQIALSMYGNLAGSHTRGTFIAGEVANVSPLGQRWPLQFDGESWSPRDAFRGIYNSPNTANNTMFLRALRMTLVHELSDDAHIPQELRLAFATPRTWLADGEEIAVRDAPTSFGPVSYRIASDVAEDRIAATVTLPEREAPRATTLRLRAPNPKRMTSVTVNGVPSEDRMNASREEIDLTGLSGTVEIEVRYRDKPKGT